MGAGGGGSGVRQVGVLSPRAFEPGEKGDADLSTSGRQQQAPTAPKTKPMHRNGLHGGARVVAIQGGGGSHNHAHPQRRCTHDDARSPAAALRWCWGHTWPDTARMPPAWTRSCCCARTRTAAARPCWCLQASHSRMRCTRGARILGGGAQEGVEWVRGAHRVRRGRAVEGCTKPWGGRAVQQGNRGGGSGAGGEEACRTC